MKNRVYYGEYSLAYWIELILKGKISLPKYQRHFVWNEKKLIGLVNSLKDDRFVPPVTIGSFNRDGLDFNFVIDGQQRLTSILLSYLDIFPSKEGFKAHLVALANGSEVIPEGEEDPYDNVLEWNFQKLVEKGDNKATILGKLETNNYKQLNLGLDADFFKNTFIGFSYIVPAKPDAVSQQRYYTKVFRDINMQGVNLMEVESRRAMYFLNAEFEDFFEPDFMAKYGVQPSVGLKQQMDFVRYLCFMTAYNKHQNVKKVARGYYYCVEKYIEDYIHSIVDSTPDGDLINLFGKFTTVFPCSDFKQDLLNLKEDLEGLDLPRDYPSIINMDAYFFGLIYHVLIKHKRIDVTRAAELKAAVESNITALKQENNNGHTLAPSQFQYLRSRMAKSIDIYSYYLLP